MAGKCVCSSREVWKVAVWFRGCTDQTSHSGNVLGFSCECRRKSTFSDARLKLHCGLALSQQGRILMHVMSRSLSFPFLASSFQFMKKTLKRILPLDLFLAFYSGFLCSVFCTCLFCPCARSQVRGSKGQALGLMW